MKKFVINNPLLSIVAVIFLLIIGGLLINIKGNGIQDLAGIATTSIDSSIKISTSSPTSNTQKPSVTTQKTVTNTKSLPITISKQVNEDEYIRQLLQNQRTCEQMAEKQFGTLYGNILTSANFDDFYTTSYGQCYMQVFGKTYVKNATSSIGHLYFRDVLNNSLLAECTSPTGGLVSNPQWSCTIKSTAKKIDKIAYDEFVNTLLSK